MAGKEEFERKRGPSDLPPGPTLTRERQTARMTMRPLAFLAELWERFGDVFTVRVLDQEPWVAIGDPDLIALVLRAPADVLHAGEGRRILAPVLGENSVILLDEERHLEQRKLLLPPFGGSHVDGYREAMHTAAIRAIEGWPAGPEEPALPWTRAIALEVILEAVFGVGAGERLGPMREALRALRLPGNAAEAGAAAFLDARAHADRLIYDEIADRRGGHRTTGEDVLSLLLSARHDDGSPMSDVEIRDELMSLLVAGYETAATTLAWALSFLARDRERLARAAEQARRAGGPYLKAAVEETLRIRPAIPLVARQAKSPFRLGERTLPAGATLMPALLLLHHRPDLYPDPSAFRPERFLDAPPDPSIWLPFGGGVRRCLGARFAMLEAQVVLATLLERFDLRPARGKPDAMRRRDVTLAPSRGAPVVLEAR